MDDLKEASNVLDEIEDLLKNIKKEQQLENDNKIDKETIIDEIEEIIDSIEVE